jgi:GDPmannose 4,6-dehydratase
MKKAFITGITGQDGVYLTQLLLEKGYEVHGLKRRSSSCNLGNLKYIFGNDLTKVDNLHLHEGDLTDFPTLISLIGTLQPEEIYNLGAMSHVYYSFVSPEYTANVDALGLMRVLEAVKINNLNTKTKVYQASTSELYGKVIETPQSETTPFYPRSPYAISKQYAYWNIVNYREAYNMFACNGILFNHESPLRGEHFVTRKITLAAASISKGLSTELVLGNLDAKRDWGYAKEYVEGMWRMLQADKPDDYVLATGYSNTVRDFVNLSFKHVGIDLDWKGDSGTITEYAVNKSNGNTIVKVSPEFYRPTEVEFLLGDATKAKEKLGWEPTTTLEQLVEKMVKADLKRLES